MNDALQAASDQTRTSAHCCHFAVQQASQRQAANAACHLLLPEALVIWGHTKVLSLNTSINPYLSKAHAANLAHDLLQLCVVCTSRA